MEKHINEEDKIRKNKIKEAELTVIYFGEDIIITSGGIPSDEEVDIGPDE